MKTVGLRIDVDTYRGTKFGVPALNALLAEFDIKGTFYFSVGPDNMGRHLWRLLKPRFLLKMLRSNAASLYGWDILFKGTFWPGPQIAKNLGSIIRDTKEAGHEIGLHAWDHHAWQSHIYDFSEGKILEHLGKGFRALEEAAGMQAGEVRTVAAPGWRCSDAVLFAKSRLPLDYNSDCRGAGVFRPNLGGRVIEQPQVPVNLPTYDEVIGRNGISDENYNAYLIELIEKNDYNVLTIHAEVEGGSRLDLFRDFLERARALNVKLVPLNELLKGRNGLETASLEQGEMFGREGQLALKGLVS